ncbi:acetate kinase [Steroidobacter denitrificans]|uniref:Acetate kinase n=1 Tax=Steroidobacter denitrificans TaxID=465721 RepID=A0A127FB24_STEDE|nr:acetate/propionate family kinase [Steroidobacter denitrificans]AMN47623.1 acetate kinase [Steroidobacter denitrificans]
MLVLALNCGSSSVKMALIEVEPRSVGAHARRMFDARVEGMGGASCRVHTRDGEIRECEGLSLRAAVSELLEQAGGRARIRDTVQAVAHRVVHGGGELVRPTLIDETSLSTLDSIAALAPLHNPPAAAAIRICRELLPELPHVAVFDTAFHATLPPRAREYALPREVTERFGIRRYGFHGTSHAHVLSAACVHMNATPQELRIISCHLGNGASVAAIEYGRSVETSMGMTPLEGLVMGTRCGDIDPGVLLHLLQSAGFDASALDELLNSRAGLTGLTGTNDMREIERRAARGDEHCRLAITLYAHRIRKYIGAYAAVMGGVEVIAFTGGVGENSALVRHRCMQRLDFLGAVLDEDANRDAGFDEFGVACISEEYSRTRLLVVRADEESAIAGDAAELLARRDADRATGMASARIPVAISARHAHLSQATIDRLFGPGYVLRQRAALSQPGQFAAQESVALIGPGGRIDGVRVLGPPRVHDQIEISRTDEFTLGVDAPVRISGDLLNTPGITLEGPRGRVTLPNGLISARRHIHMSPEDAALFGVRDCDTVQVKLDTDGRDLIFGDVMVRVSPDFNLEMHLDTDEANAAGVKQGDEGELILRGASDAFSRDGR